MPDEYIRQLIPVILYTERKRENAKIARAKKSSLRTLQYLLTMYGTDIGLYFYLENLFQSIRLVFN